MNQLSIPFGDEKNEIQQIKYIKHPVTKTQNKQTITYYLRTICNVFNAIAAGSVLSKSEKLIKIKYWCIILNAHSKWFYSEI